jgi:hypothetical protein
MLRFNTLSNLSVDLKATVRAPGVNAEPRPAPASLADLDALAQEPNYQELWTKANVDFDGMRARAAELKALDNQPGDLNPQVGVVVLESQRGRDRFAEILTVKADEEKGEETRFVSRRKTPIGVRDSQVFTNEYVGQGDESALASRWTDGALTVDKVYQQNHTRGTIAIFS